MKRSFYTPEMTQLPIPKVDRKARAAAAHSGWLRDYWYVIAWDHEIPAADSADLFHRTVLGEPILVMRTTDALVALEDRCVHRLAPLSKGRREGDDVRCGYHGLKFNSCGVCIEAPGIAKIPDRARVKTYPVVVKNKWVFVWMGDPAAADEALLPDNFSNDHPDWNYRPGYMKYDTPYLLICDNLLDFSHLSYVHEKTLGGSPLIALAVPTIEVTPGPNEAWPQVGVKVSRRIHDVPPSPFYKRFRQFDSTIDRWFIYDFVLPGTLLMHSGGRPIHDAEDDMSRAVLLHSCQTVTPESETSTHYFFQQSHRVGHGDGEVAETMYQGLLAAFEEDRQMISAQYENIQLDPDAPMLALGMDKAVLQFRRLLQERLESQDS